MASPLLLIITGRPASGKTTLANQLSQMLKYPLISRDSLKEGYIQTVQVPHTQLDNTAAIHIYNTFFQVIDVLLTNGISLIAEAAFQDKLWQPSLNDPNAPLKVCPFDAIGAAQLLPSGNLYLHDINGVFYTALRTDGTYSDISPLSEWGQNDHPFDLEGLGAATEDIGNRVIHFNKAGDQYIHYSINQPFGTPRELWQFGPDNTLPIDNVGAAVRLELAHYYYIFFDQTGKNYAVYKHPTGVVGYYQL